MTKTNKTDDLINDAQAERNTATDSPNTRRASQSQGLTLSAPEQARDGALASSRASAKAGQIQAITDAKAYAQQYVRTTEVVTAVVNRHVELARDQMSAAISSVEIEDVLEDVNSSDFLEGFSLELNSLLDG